MLARRCWPPITLNSPQSFLLVDYYTSYSSTVLAVGMGSVRRDPTRSRPSISSELTAMPPFSAAAHISASLPLGRGRIWIMGGQHVVREHLSLECLEHLKKLVRWPRRLASVEKAFHLYILLNGSSGGLCTFASYYGSPYLLWKSLSESCFLVSNKAMVLLQHM